LNRIGLKGRKVNKKNPLVVFEAFAVKIVPRVSVKMFQPDVILFRPFCDKTCMKAATAVLEGGGPLTCMMPIDFGVWMLAEQKRIFLLCFRVLRNRDEADSATQDVFVEAYRALERSGDNAIQDPAKWLTRVALNTCYDCLRSKRWKFWQRRVSGESEEIVFRTKSAGGPNPEETLMGSEFSGRIRDSLHRLSERQRLVFVLRFEEDYSLAEIAEALDLDLGTVKAHMARAIKKLREELRGFYVQ
jgi:RNA polymerase sigma-70 factor, ECF subfamily